MDRELFAARLAKSAEAAWTFARTMIAEELPEPLVFRVRGTTLSKCDAETALAELWRDGRVPEWINVSVADETGTATVIELLPCDRFTDDDALLYHLREGSPPFHVLGPALPPEYDGTPFSIHLRAECWDSSDLAHLAGAADEIWSFDLHTAAFDDRALFALPDMPHMKNFQHHACTLGDRGLSPFARFPQLRFLRLHLTDTFHIGNNGPLSTLTDLEITGLPPTPWGQSSLTEIAPSAAGVSLSARGALWLDGPFSPSVQSLQLTAAEVVGRPCLPPSLEHLTIRLTHSADQQVAALLEGVTHIGSLTLRGTPVTDAVIPTLEQYSLRHLDLVETSVTAEALARFHAGHPEVSLLPRPHPYQASDLKILNAPDNTYPGMT